MSNAHNRRHQDLMRCLALGVLSDTEINEAAALLETCPECPADLARYQAEIMPEEPVPAVARGVLVQFPLTLAGPERAVEKEIGRLRELVGARAGFELLRCQLAAAAGGDVAEVLPLTATEAARDELVRIAREFLDERERDAVRSKATTVASDMWVRRDPATNVLQTVRRTATKRIRPKDAAALVIAVTEE